MPQFACISDLTSQNLVERDFNLSDDIFVYNRHADSIERVSVSSEGTEANRGAVSPTISANGQVVAFFSESDNLVPNDPQGTDLFVFDRSTDTIERVDGNGTDVSLSGDGRFVVFSSSASNLDPTDSNGHADVFVYDRSLQTFERISIASDGSEADGDSVAGSISENGRFIAFASGATNLVQNDTNNTADVFLYDREENSIQRISVSSEGVEANGPSLRPLLSGNGQFVIFDSQASDLLAVDNDAIQDVFVYDRIQQTIELVSMTHDGSAKTSDSPTPLSSALSVSTDGRLVGFSSNVSNLAINNSLGGVFERDRQAGATTRIFDENFSVDISGDGRYITTSGEHLSLYDLENGSDTIVTDYTPTSTTFVIESTITLTAGSQFSVSGQVNLDNSLLVEDESIVGLGETFTSTFNTITSSDIGANLIGPLSQLAGIAPVHPLLRGNPAIDSADIRFAGTIAQNGVVREIPDIGAYEAVSASVAGHVFVDLNQNRRRDPGEPGIGDVQVTVKDARNETQSITVDSSDDSIETIGIDELGLIEFPELSAGTYDFTLSLAPEWEFSREPISRVKRPGIESNGLSSNPSISADGRFIVFEC